MTTPDAVRIVLATAVIITVVVVAAWLWDRRATKAINSHTDAALLHGGERLATDDGTEAQCLDCAQDQAIGITRDGSHDGGELSTQEEFEWLEITREFYREAS